jgi:hypothetical protein
LGIYHASDLIPVFFGIYPNYASAAFPAHYLSFVSSFDPNEGTDSKWRQWKENKQLLNMYADYSQIITDDFRSTS